MRSFLLFLCCGLALPTWTSGSCHAAPAGKPLRPRWQVGQRWVVETTRQAIHTSEGGTGRPVRWRFTVLGRERVAGASCLWAEITCVNVPDVPATTIWVDEKTLALRQVETGMMVQGEVRRVRERYDADTAGGAPVVGPLGAIPLDLPVVEAEGVRSGRFGYRAKMEDETADNVDFAVEVEQRFQPAKRAVARGLLGGKDDRATYEVNLLSGGREVRQLWQADQPWPSYSAGEGTITRLISVDADLVPVSRAVASRSSRRATPPSTSEASRPHLVTSVTDEGKARFVPWSGDWWKIKDQRMLGPLRKYDVLTGKRSRDWERKNKDPRKAREWSGYCHAWSAAAVMEREPRGSRSVRGPGGRSLMLGVGDQKAWLTVCHDNDEAVSYGQRYNGKAGDDPQDIYPDHLWRWLRLYVKQRGVPLILDIDPGTAVWNYPVYRYKVTHHAHRNGLRLGTMTIWMADDKVKPDFVGTKVKKKTYQFTFRLKGRTLVLGSGQWYGASRKDHPDFAWYPTMVRPKNPHIRPGTVRRMLGRHTTALASRSMGGGRLTGAWLPDLDR